MTVATNNTQQIPTGFTIDVQPGPDGKPSVVIMLQCGAVTGAMSVPPDVADEWADKIPTLMRAAAEECRKRTDTPERRGGLVTADATALVQLNRAGRRNTRR